MDTTKKYYNTFMSFRLRLLGFRKLFALLFVLTVTVGFFVRFYRLNSIPVGLHFDEAQAGYNAYLIGETGKNIQGQKFPLYIDSWGDYRPALISYLAIIPVKILGLTALATRLPTTIGGVIVGIIGYFLAKICYQNKKIALLTMILAMVSPYATIVGRGTLEGVIDAVFNLTAVILLIKVLKDKEIRWLPLIYLCYLLGYFSYMTGRMLAPLFWFSTVAIGCWQYRPSKKILLLTTVPLILYLIFPFFYFLKSPVGVGRFNQTSIFTFPQVQEKLNVNIGEDRNSTNFYLTRILHNKIIAYGTDLGQRYLTFFSPNPMLFRMREPGRHYVENVGPITMVEYIGLVFAIVFFFSKKFRPITLLPLVLLLLSPLPAATTHEGFPNFSRIPFFTPLWQSVAVFGLITFLENKTRTVKTILILTITVIVIWQTAYWLHAYLIHGPIHPESIATRTTEMAELARFLSEEKNSGKNIILSENDGVYIYYLFYNKINIFNTNYKKTGVYFNGDFALYEITFTAGPCISPGEILKQKFDTVIIRSGCPFPVFGKETKKFYRTDESLALTAFDLTTPSAQIYKEYFDLESQHPDDQVLIKLRREIEHLFTY